jgi:hypothetical protein
VQNNGKGRLPFSSPEIFKRRALRFSAVAGSSDIQSGGFGGPEDVLWMQGCVWGRGFHSHRGESSQVECITHITLFGDDRYLTATEKYGSPRARYRTSLFYGETFRTR